MTQDLTIQQVFDTIKAQQLARGVDFANITQDQKKVYAGQCAHALSVEVSELASSWAFAPWKTTSTDVENIKRETVDCLFFLVNICLCFDISHDVLGQTFDWVVKNNYSRIHTGEHKEVDMLIK